MFKIISILFFYFSAFNLQAADSDALLRMYERLEIVTKQMQILIEENQQLKNEISNLKEQQNRLYQDLLKKIELLNETKTKIENKEVVIKNKSPNNKSKEDQEKQLDFINKEKKNIIPQDEAELDLAQPYINNDFKKNLAQYENKSEIELYRSAFQLVKDKKYKDAIDSFNAFLFLHPESNYSSNAQYWLSESIYALGDYKDAMINFAKVVENYPTSSKIADAKLKIGYCYYSIKKWKEARFIFSNIIKDYPNTSLSQLAEKKIKSMDVEGR